MSQADKIIKHLKRGRTITPIEALNMWGVLRLAARVSDLRNKGYRIETVTVCQGKKHFAKYRLTKKPQHIVGVEA